MSLVALVVFIFLIGLLIYLAQNVPSPWSLGCYAAAILFVILALLQVLGYANLPLGAHG